MKYLSIENNKIVNQIRISNVDITEPRFSINSSSQKILVTAKEGNFIEENKILLKKNRLELLQMLCKTFENYINFSKIESI